MTTLLSSLNTTREEIINKHYQAALAELKSKIAIDPLKTVFFIYSGCINKEVTDEIVHRLGVEGIKAKLCRSGMITTKYLLQVDIVLPEQLVHQEIAQ